MVKIRLLVGFTGTFAFLLSGCAGGSLFRDRPPLVMPFAEKPVAEKEQISTATTEAIQVPKNTDHPLPAKAESGVTATISDEPISDSALKRLKPLSAGNPQLFADFKQALGEADPKLRSMLLQRLEAEYLFQQRKTNPKNAIKSNPNSITPPVSHQPVHPKPDEAQQTRTQVASHSNKSPTSPAPPTKITTTPNNEDKATPTVNIVVSTASSSTPEEESAIDWEIELQSVIQLLKKKINDQSLDEAERAQLETYLRLLYIVADQRAEAVKPIANLDENEQVFWSEQLYALSEILSAKRAPRADRRAALVLRHLRQAEKQLEKSSALDVHHLAFCTSVDGYGLYTEFPKSQFKPNQEVLLYFEVDNFVAEKLSNGFETSLVGNYQILDGSGRRIADNTFPTDTAVCQNYRRDFFMRYHIYMPKSIAPGSYTLQLMIEDLKGNKFGQGSIPFSIRKAR